MTSIPPESNSGSTTGGTSRTNLTAFLESLGATGRSRPEPHISRSLVGIGGALVPIGLAILFTGDESSTTGLYIAALLTFGLTLIGRLKNVIPTDLISGTTSAAVVGLVLFFVTLIGDTEMDPGLGLLLAGAAHVAVWFAPGFRGSSLFLGTGAFVTVLALADIFTGSNDTIENDLASDLPIDVTAYLSRAGVAYLIFGTLLIVGVFYLDKRGFQAVGTALVPAGLLSVIVGALLTIQDMNNAGVGILLFLVGIGLSLIGHEGGRRGLTWWGATIVGFGVVAFFAFAIEPESNSSTGITVLVAAVLLVGGPRLVDAVKKLNSET